MAVSVGKRLAWAVVPFAFRLAALIVFATCRVEERGRERFAALERAEERPFVMAFWHYSLFGIVYFFRALGPRTVAMVSSSEDAEFVSRLLQGYGTVTVRGSRNRRGVAALKEMIAVMRGGRRVGAIVADGSQGPPLVAQPGAVLLASRAGAPVLPVVWAAERYWAFNSWDRTVLPKPFSKVVIRYGEPLRVPEGVRAGDLEMHRRTLDDRLIAEYRRAWEEVGRGRH